MIEVLYTFIRLTEHRLLLWEDRCERFTPLGAKTSGDGKTVIGFHRSTLRPDLAARRH